MLSRRGKYLIVLALAAFFAAPLLRAATLGSSKLQFSDLKRINADTWNIAGKNIIVTGNVYIPFGELEIFADKAVINVENKDIEVTVMDLPQQLVMMRRHTENEPGADRIGGYAINLLDEKATFPAGKQYDAIWMSQFLDCFGEKEIVSILSRATEVMSSRSRLYIMETFWNRQRYESAALCLTLTSVYFTAMANGNSKMYNSDDMARLVAQAGLEVEDIHDYLGMGHSIMVCKLN